MCFISSPAVCLTTEGSSSSLASCAVHMERRSEWWLSPHAHITDFNYELLLTAPLTSWKWLHQNESYFSYSLKYPNTYTHTHTRTPHTHSLSLSLYLSLDPNSDFREPINYQTGCFCPNILITWGFNGDIFTLYKITCSADFCLSLSSSVVDLRVRIFCN